MGIFDWRFRDRPIFQPGQWSIFGLNVPDIGLSERGLAPGEANPAVLERGALAQAPAFQPRPGQNIEAQSFPSGGLVGGVPVTTTTQPVTTTTPTGGDGGGGQRDTGQQPVDVTQFVPPQPTEAELNAIFAPAMASLAEQEAALRAGLPTQEARIRASQERALLPLEEREIATAAEIGRQQEQVGQREESALSQARRLHGQLQQQALARFGTGTSAGPAISEIVSAETARQFGAVRQNAMNQLSQLGQQMIQLKDFVGREKQLIASETEGKLEDFNLKFNNQLTLIKSRRGELESAKEAASLDALQTYRAQVAQVKYDEFLRSLDLEQWAREQEDKVKQNLSNIPTAFSPAQLEGAVDSIGQPIEFLADRTRLQEEAPGTPPSLAGFRGDIDLPAETEEERQRRLLGLA